MEDPMDRLMDHVEERSAATAQPALSAEGLRTAMYWATERQYDAAMDVGNTRDRVRVVRETMELIEAMAIDSWIASVPEADRKRIVGSNEEERKRNTLLALSRSEGVSEQRRAFIEAERSAAIAQIKLELAMERVRNLRSIAWAYGGECNRGHEPVEDRIVRRDRGIPAELVAGRAGLKLVRDTDDF